MSAMRVFDTGKAFGVQACQMALDHETFRSLSGSRDGYFSDRGEICIVKMLVVLDVLNEEVLMIR
jgi:hypothetical protein